LNYPTKVNPVPKLFWICGLLLICLISLGTGQAQDIRLPVLNPSHIVASNRQWAQMNRIYIFRPKVPQISLYIFFANRNPTNAHSFTLQVYQTPSPLNINWTNNQGFWVEDSINGTCSPVAAATMTACYVNTMFASQIAIRITGATAAAGTPDTGDIYIVQAIGEPKGQTVGSGNTVDILSPLIGGRVDINIGSTGTAVPVTDNSGSLTVDVGTPFCANHAAISLTASGSTQIIGLVGGQSIQVCHISLAFTSAVDFKLVEGTGANCVTAPADLTGAYQDITTLALDFGGLGPLIGSSGEALCANLGAVVTGGGVIIYAQN